MCSNNLLQVYKDLVVGGQWYWCPKCRFAGDSIELAARAWRMGPASAVLKLMASGVKFPQDTDEEAIQRYVREHVEGRKKVEELWRQAGASTVPLSGPLSLFARRLGIPATRPRDWASRGGQFVGVTDRLAVVKCFQPGQDMEDRHKGEQGGHRTFKGRGWDQLVAIPHRDLPGRIAGLLLIGRDARFPDDYIYKRTNLAAADANGDFGISMMEAIVRPHPDFGDLAFSCTDPVEAVRLQLAHLAEHGHPLPLAGAWGPKTSLAWSMLPARATIAFGPEATPAEAARLLRHARGLRGRVGRAGRPDQRPVEALKAVAKDAVGWQSRLEDHLQARPPHEAEDVFLQVGLERGDAARFLRECIPAAAAKVRGVTDIDAAVRSVELGRRLVVEGDGIWKDGHDGALISDVVVRVDRVVHQRRRGRVVFEGTLHRKGASAPFVVDQDTAEGAPAAWLRKACIEGGLGMPSVEPHWPKRLFQVGQLFHEPAFVETEGVLGWDDARNAFAFPRFTVAMGGLVAPDDAAVAEEQPGLRFDMPDGLTPEQVQALSREDGATRLLWAAAASVAAAAVSPCLGLEPSSIAFAGTGSVHAAIPAARAMGCPVVEVQRRVALAVARVCEMQKAFNWPVAVSYTDRRTGDKDTPDLPPGVVCRVGSWAADVLSLLGGWVVVDADAHGVSTLPIMAHGPVVLPNYLRHFCSGHFYAGGANLVDAVLEDMAGWFGGRGGNPHAVRRAASIVRTDDEGRFPDRFADLVSRLFYEGDLVSTRSDVGEPYPRQPALAVLEGGLLHIPRAGVARSLARRDAPHLDVAIVTRRLASAGVLIDERDHGGHPGWVVHERWWSDRLCRWRVRNQAAYRKVD